jgi:hypothetical protein
MKKPLTLTLIVLFAGASLFAQKPHHEKDGHKEMKREYKHHPYHRDYHKHKTVVILTTAPRPPSGVIRLPSPPRPPSVNIKLPSPPLPPRPPR